MHGGLFLFFFFYKNPFRGAWGAEPITFFSFNSSWKQFQTFCFTLRRDQRLKDQSCFKPKLSQVNLLLDEEVEQSDSTCCIYLVIPAYSCLDLLFDEEMLSVLNLYKAGRCMTNRDRSTVGRGWDRGAMPIIGLLPHLEWIYEECFSYLSPAAHLRLCVKHKIDFFYHYSLPLWELLPWSEALGFLSFKSVHMKIQKPSQRRVSQSHWFWTFCSLSMHVPFRFNQTHSCWAEPQSSAFCFHIQTFLLVR